MVKKIFKVTFLFLLFCIPSVSKLNDICKIYKSSNFDAQALLTWDYTSYLKLFPYKQVFYPYGLLAYYQSQNIFFQAVNFLLTPLLYTIFFIIFQKIFKNNFFSILTIILFYSFIEKFIGHEIFNRYGVIAALSCISAFLFHRKTYLSEKMIFILGLTTGIIFSLLIDQGIYVFLIIILFIFVNPVLKQGIKNISSLNYYKHVGKSAIFFIMSILVGLFPFLVYLTYNGSLHNFYLFLLRLSDMSLYAKAAFFPYSRSPENLFTFTSIFLTISSITYNVFFKKTNLNFIFYLQLSLIGVLIFLEQKSFIRSIAEQITFISLLLFILLFLRSRIRYLLPYICIIGIVFIYKWPSDPASGTFAKENLSPKACLNKNINNFLTGRKEYRLVKQKIEKDFGYKGKIFSFPGDPIFYLMFNQIPPFYSNNYDSSSINAQKKQIAYMENGAEYVIYNLNIPAIQDGVPNYIRTPEEMKYILNNFSPIEKINNFLILRKNKNVDIFENIYFNNDNTLKEYLLNVNLYSIPYSEALYKDKRLEREKFSEFSKGDVISSKNKIIILRSKQKNYNKTVVIKIKTKEGLETRIYFQPCRNVNCIINLSHVPLFYRERQITDINLPVDFLGKIQIAENKDGFSLW